MGNQINAMFMLEIDLNWLSISFEGQSKLQPKTSLSLNKPGSSLEYNARRGEIAQRKNGGQWIQDPGFEYGQRQSD